MQHENERLVARKIKWLGIYTTELAGIGLSKDELIPINKHDEKKALTMLRRPNLPKRWRKELQHMLHNRRKAEIEVLSLATQSMFISGCSDDGPRLGAHALNSLPPLMHYLIAKISTHVAAERTATGDQ
ncbi:predicted protein [Postia placenta Mad-698-R]|uniref:Topoisomerase 6 subunit A/Spo11 TOPRIM domain-containing protein n=1 Tax=Postia placenta MAD-698-R-SB12 TaxID=670580 RepID=A0A1X6NC84_9APHY|nr:hypothetical protein POSPLADRAFT_1043681 [Postia placenta MAD-698-R-SB12]EED84539.1 predicted protein [Postia placenta Mad-698-R]OSX66211.1 hypothetical protein POSPLADRAFT_1043681 [Postia placenta MAD-698-R-SB12]